MFETLTELEIKELIEKMIREGWDKTKQKIDIVYLKDLIFYNSKLFTGASTIFYILFCYFIIIILLSYIYF